MTAHWYISVYDRKTERLVTEELLGDVSSDAVRQTFEAEPDAVGGFEVLASHIPFITLHSSVDVDLSECIAFVELLEDENQL